MSLSGKYLIGQENLGNGRDFIMLEHESTNSCSIIETVLKDRLVTAFGLYYVWDIVLKRDV